jgi:acyl transferase domain-containing protein
VNGTFSVNFPVTAGNDSWLTSGKIDVMLSEAGSYPIDEPRFAQPLCTAIQIALVDLLNSFGLRPAAVVGHSSGEIAAAWVLHSGHERFRMNIG